METISSLSSIQMLSAQKFTEWSKFSPTLHISNGHEYTMQMGILKKQFTKRMWKVVGMDNFLGPPARASNSHFLKWRFHSIPFILFAHSVHYQETDNAEKETKKIEYLLSLKFNIYVFIQILNVRLFSLFTYLLKFISNFESLFSGKLMASSYRSFLKRKIWLKWNHFETNKVIAPSNSEKVE